MMKWFSKPESELYSKVKFSHSKFYFEDSTKPSKISIPKSEYVEVSLNGSVVSGEITFNKDDQLVITYLNNVVTEPTCDLSVEVDDKKKEAKLKKTITKGTGYQLEPIQEFTLNPKLKVSCIVIAPEPYAFDEIDSFLRKESLNGIFLDENIHLIAVSEETIELPVVIAKEAKAGLPARFELIGDLQDGTHLSKEHFFAEYVDETPGVSGYDVYGIEIQPEDLFFFPEFGENVLVEDRGLMSLKEGRLVFNQHDINVIEEISVKQTFTWEDGMVEYDGDVVIDGNIKEGGQIKCTGNLTILGGVFESYVFADGNIEIKGNADQSVIYSGFSKIAAKQIETYSLQYLEVFERVMFETSFAVENGDYEEKTKSLELAKSEFAHIQQSIDPFLSLVQQFGNNETKALFNMFSTVCTESVKVVLDDQSNSEDMRSEMEKFYQLIDDSKGMLKDGLGTLYSGSANSSHLFAYQEIEVTGTGTFQTIIDSNNSVKVSGQSLSTNITAEHLVDVNEFRPGNQNEYKIYVKKSSGMIKINKLHSDSLLQLGSKQYISIDDEVNIVYENSNFPKNKA